MRVGFNRSHLLPPQGLASLEMEYDNLCSFLKVAPPPKKKSGRKSWLCVWFLFVATEKVLSQKDTPIYTCHIGERDLVTTSECGGVYYSGSPGIAGFISTKTCESIPGVIDQTCKAHWSFHAALSEFENGSWFFP